MMLFDGCLDELTWRHSRPKGIEDSGNADVDAVLSEIAKRQSLGDTFSFVVARSYPLVTIEVNSQCYAASEK